MTQKLLRHAYLIMAHNNFEILEKQVLLLDSPNADFYIHVDKKAGAFPAEALAALPQHSKIVFTEPLCADTQKTLFPERGLPFRF